MGRLNRREERAAREFLAEGEVAVAIDQAIVKLKDRISALPDGQRKKSLRSELAKLETAALFRRIAWRQQAEGIQLKMQRRDKRHA